MRWTIRRKLTLFTLLLVLISIGALGTYLYRVAEKSLSERIGQGMSIQASSMITQIDRMIYERFTNVQNWAGEEMMFDILTDDPQKRIADFLATMKKEYGFYKEIICADNSGKIIAASEKSLIGKNISGESWFQQVKSSVQPKVFDLAPSEIDNERTAILAAPIMTDSLVKQVRSSVKGNTELANMLAALEKWQPKTLGVLAAHLDWTQMIEMLNTMPVLEGKTQGPEAYALLINKKGLVITQPYFESRATMFRENLKDKGLTAAENAINGKNGFVNEMGRYEKQDLIGFSPSKGYRNFLGFGWAVLVFQDAGHALAPIQQIKIQTVSIGLLVAILATIMGIFLTRGMTKPLEELANFTRSVGKGDLTATVRVKSSDEIGALAASFNEMIHNLQSAKVNLTAAKDFADNIIRSMADLLFVVDPEGHIKTCNPAVSTILGYSENELLGRSVDTLFSDESRMDYAAMRGLEEGSVSNKDFELKNKAGDPVPMLVSATVLKDEHGTHQGVVLIAKDMREYKSLQGQFLEAQKMDAVGKLAGGIAHDFNNMLTVINGYSEMLLVKIKGQEKITSDLHQINRAGRKAASLTRQLLAFSRRHVVKPMVIDLNELIMGMKKMLQLITGENIELVILPLQGIWPIKIDPGEFEQVLTNLTVNARDAMPEGGKLIMATKNATVTALPEGLPIEGQLGDYTLLEIRDSGTGMTEEIKKRIFEPFFTTKPVGKGTGLGLATCFNVVKTAGGFIDVQTEIGKGTCFKIYLPRNHGKAQNITEDSAAAALPRGSETILLVEDDELVREFAGGLLKEHGYQVISVGNGSEALRAVEEKNLRGEKIHLLLTDVVMPRMGGRELAEKTQALIPDIKVILMSGYIDDEEVLQNIKESRTTFIPKPITPGVLMHKLRQVLEGDKSGEDNAQAA